MVGMGEKTQKEKVNRIKEKPVLLLSHHPIYKMEAYCFLISEGFKNKPDLP